MLVFPGLQALQGLVELGLQALQLRRQVLHASGRGFPRLRQALPRLFELELQGFGFVTLA